MFVASVTMDADAQIVEDVTIHAPQAAPLPLETAQVYCREDAVAAAAGPALQIQ